MPGEWITNGGLHLTELSVNMRIPGVVPRDGLFGPGPATTGPSWSKSHVEQAFCDAGPSWEAATSRAGSASSVAPAGPPRSDTAVTRPGSGGTLLGSLVNSPRHVALGPPASWHEEGNNGL
jgi:hypothetical protein